MRNRQPGRSWVILGWPVAEKIRATGVALLQPKFSKVFVVALPRQRDNFREFSIWATRPWKLGIMSLNPIMRWKDRADRRGGFECGASGAKLVLLTCRESTVCVDRIFIEEESFESRHKGHPRPPLEISRQLLIQRDLTGYKTVFVADEATAGCFVIIPKMTKVDSEGAMLLQARKLLSWESAEPIMAHLDSEFLRDRTGSVLGLADWKAVKPWCKLVEGSGGLMDDVTVRACAYQALAERQRWADEHPVLLVADFGALSSCFYVLDHQVVKFMREVPVGGDAVTKALTTEVSTDNGAIHLNEIEAEKLKISGDLLRMDMMMRPVIERMSAEVMRSIQFFKENTGQKVDGVYITGGTARLRALKTHLESTIPVPVKTIDPFTGLDFLSAGVKSRAEEHKARLAVAVGLGLSQRPAVSLLPKSVQISKRLAGFAPMAVAILLALGFFPLIFGVIFQTVRIQRIRPEIKKYKEELAVAVRYRQEMEALQAQLRQSSDYYNTLKSLTVRSPLWAGIMNALADAVPRDIVLTHFSTEFRKGGTGNIILKGQVLPSAAVFDEPVSSFLSSLSSSVFFSHVSVANAEINRTDEMLGTFEIQCEIVY